jgi:multicomponent Na+:H+ antiporter subunit G
MNLLTTILVGVCLLSGAFFMLAAAVGIVRLPDVLCRSHALAKAMTLGIILMLAGLWLHLGREEGFSGLKITLAVFFQVVTVPVASHLLSLLAWERNLSRWRHRPVVDHRRPQSVADSTPVRDK